MRAIRWMGGSLNDLSSFPRDVKRAFGYALRETQKGNTPAGAVPLRQFGSGVFELRDSFVGDAFRAVYAVKLEKAVYVLHVFKKKSKTGIGMPRSDIAVIQQRLKRAQAMDAAVGEA